MAKFIKQELPDMNKTGEKKSYYRMESSGRVSMRELVHSICSHPGSGLSEGTVYNAFMDMVEEMARRMAEGYSVSLDGLGTFAATIGLRNDGEEPDIEKTDGYKKGQSLKVKSVRFRADKQLVKRVGSQCQLQRGGTSRVKQSDMTLEERLAAALAYLDDARHPFMRTKDYAALTHQSYASACLDLRKFKADPASGIVQDGDGNSRVYVRGGAGE